MMPWNTRYFLPADAAMIYILGVAVSYIKWNIPRKAAALLLLIPFIINTTQMYGTAKERFPVALGTKSRTDYLINTYSFYKAIYRMNDIAEDDDFVWFLDRKGYRLDPDYTTFPTDIPGEWERDNAQFHETLLRNNIDYILVSRPYWLALVSIDAILTSIRPGGPGDIRLHWEDISEILKNKGLPTEYAGDIIFAMGMEKVSPWRYTVDEDYIKTRWPDIDYFAAFASSFPEMSQRGYLETIYADGMGWVYKVAVE